MPKKSKKRPAPAPAPAPEPEPELLDPMGLEGATNEVVEDESSEELDSADEGIVLQMGKQEADELLAAAKRPTKKRKTGKGEKEEVKEEDEEGDGKGAVVTIEFGFWDPQPSDFHSVKLMMKSYIDVNKGEFDLSGFTEAICEQVTVGSMVKADGTEGQPIGLLTALNVHQHAKKEFMKQIRSFVLSHAPDDATKTKLEQLWCNGSQKTKTRLGLLVNARLLNVPQQLVPTLHDALLQDLTWAQSAENEDETPAERADWGFDHFLVIGRRILFDQPYRGRKDKAPATATSSGSASAAMGNEPCFRLFEEEHFNKRAAMSYSFRCKEPKAYSESELIPQEHVVMLLSKKEFAAAVLELNALV